METLEERRLADILMYLIDSFISLQLRAKNLKEEDRYKYLIDNYRNILSDEFENHIKSHPIYLMQIKNRESGPYAKDAFDINHQPNLLNL